MHPIIYYLYCRTKLAEYASNEAILDAAKKYYDNDDPTDPKRRYDHVLDTMEVAKKIRGRELTPEEFAMLAFHDTGYKQLSGMPSKADHPLYGSKIFRKEGPKLGFTKDEIKHIAHVIRMHMRKPKATSRLLNDDLQLLMFSSDIGSPVDPKDYARKVIFNNIRKGKIDMSSRKKYRETMRKLFDKFTDISDEPYLKYYKGVYPDRLPREYEYAHSGEAYNDFKDRYDDFTGDIVKL